LPLVPSEAITITAGPSWSVLESPRGSGPQVTISQVRTGSSRAVISSYDTSRNSADSRSCSSVSQWSVEMAIGCWGYSTSSSRSPEIRIVHVPPSAVAAASAAVASVELAVSSVAAVAGPAAVDGSPAADVSAPAAEVGAEIGDVPSLPPPQAETRRAIVIRLSARLMASSYGGSLAAD